VSQQWSFRVVESFRLTGRGTAVVGELRGVIPRSPVPGEIHADGVVVPVAAISVEFARTADSEEIALVLRGIKPDQVPIGATIRPPS
jgi:hypothetical protein